VPECDLGHRFSLPGWYSRGAGTLPQQLRQLGEVGSNPPRLIRRKQLSPLIVGQAFRALQNKSAEISLRPSPRSYCANFDLRHTLQPSIDILAHLILGKTIALLDDAFELLSLSVYQSQIVVGEFTPFLSDRALLLFPISRDAVPIHCAPPIIKRPLAHDPNYRNAIGTLIYVKNVVRFTDNVSHKSHRLEAMTSSGRVPDPLALRPTWKRNLFTLLIVAIVLAAIFS
jgi:hypothetical protein